MITDTREKFRPFTKPEDFERIVERDTVSEMWEICVRDFGGRTAVRDYEREYTYSQLESDAAGFRTLILEKTAKESSPS